MPKRKFRTGLQIRRVIQSDFLLTLFAIRFRRNQFQNASVRQPAGKPVNRMNDGNLWAKPVITFSSDSRQDCRDAAAIESRPSIQYIADAAGNNELAGVLRTSSHNFPGGNCGLMDKLLSHRRE